MRVIRALPYAACVLALAGAAACGTQGDATQQRPAQSATVVKRLAISVSGTEITPAPSQVDLRVGEAIELTVTVDHDDELHAHGFDDASADLSAGVPATVRLVGAESGVFEVETHEPALTLLTVAVR